MTADLFMTYLKDQCECLLRIDRGTEGVRWIYRRMPPDAAGPMRMLSLLSRGGILPHEVNIQIYLLPPEVLTLSLYLPQDLDPPSLRQMVCSEVLPGLQYPNAYDLQNFPLSYYPNGHGDVMVVVSLLGRAILPGLSRVLGSLCSQVRFVGDGLQFLRIEQQESETIIEKPYQVVLKRGDRFFIAGFRLGQHVASCSLRHPSRQLFSGWHYLGQTGYLEMEYGSDLRDVPMIQAIHPPDEFKRLGLSMNAYPLWKMANGGLSGMARLNHSEWLPALESKGSILPELPNHQSRGSFRK